MNEVLLRRLVGAGVLVVSTLVLTSLLPKPQALPPPGSGARRVTYELEAAALPMAESSTAPVAQDTAAAVVTEGAEVAQAQNTVVVPQPAPQITVKPAPATPAKTKAAPAPPKVEAAPSAEYARARAESPAPAAPSAPSTSAATAPSPAAAADGAWFVQVGAYAKEANARTSVEKLQQAGLPARRDVVAFKAGPRHRVRSGPYGSREEAEAQRARVVQIGFGDARIAREPDS